MNGEAFGLLSAWRRRPWLPYTDGMEAPIAFHYLARGVVTADGRVLVARQLGASNAFLPGGHIERGERAEEALIREIEEEIGIRPTIKRFLGAIEHAWPEDARTNHEINLLFEIDIEGLTSREPPASLEPHLEFLWVEPSRLADVNLQPLALISLLKTGVGAFEAFWGSSLGEA